MPQDAAAGACTWYIRHVDLFDRLAQRDADDLARALAPRRFAAGHLIVGPEPDPDQVYVMVNGTVRLFQRGLNGHDLTIERLNAGHLFGVTGLLGTRRARRMLAEAETEVDLGIVEQERFVEILARWPQALLQLVLRLGVRVPAGEESLGRVSATGSRARLAAVLNDLALDATDHQPGGGVRLRNVPRHTDLADQIGASRETVTRMLRRLEEDGYIRRFGRQIVIPDLKRLADDFEIAR